jgi:predicted transcriptional regulator
VVVSEQKALIDDLLDCKNFKLYSIDKDVKLSFTVTESFLNLGLSRVDGSYDLGTDLIYSGEKATEWGRMLFQHYRSLSEQLENV